MVRWIVESGRSTRLSVLVGEHIAAADMVGRTHQPFLLHPLDHARGAVVADPQLPLQPACRGFLAFGDDLARSEEHTSELQSLMRISYAVFCLKQKKQKKMKHKHQQYKRKTHITNHITIIHID